MDFAHLDGLMADVDPVDRDRIMMLARSIGEPLIAAAAEAAQIRARAAQRAADIMSRLDVPAAPQRAQEPVQSRPSPKAKPKAAKSQKAKDPAKVKAWVTRRANDAKRAGGQA